MSAWLAVLEWMIRLVLIFMSACSYIVGDALPDLLIPIYIMLYLNTLMFLLSRGRNWNTQMAILIGMTTINVLFLIFKYGLWMYWGYAEAGNTFGRSYMAQEQWVEVILIASIYIIIGLIVVAYRFVGPIKVLMLVVSWIIFPMCVIMFDLFGFYDTTAATWFFIGLLMLTKVITEIDDRWKHRKIVIVLRDYYTLWCIFGLFVVGLILVIF